MSGKVWGLVWDRFPGGEAPLLVMLAMADVANDHGCNIFPSVANLAVRCRLRKTSCTRILTQLKAAGWISEEPYHMVAGPGGQWRQIKEGGRGHLKVYRMNLHRLHISPAVRAGFDTKEWRSKGNPKEPFTEEKGSPKDIHLKGHPKTPFDDKGSLSSAVKDNFEPNHTIDKLKTNPVVVRYSTVELSGPENLRQLQPRILEILKTVKGLDVVGITHRRQQLLDAVWQMGCTTQHEQSGLPWRDAEDALGWFEQFAAYCNNSNYLKKHLTSTGRIDFEWLLDLDRVFGMLEARYHDVVVGQ